MRETRTRLTLQGTPWHTAWPSAEERFWAQTERRGPDECWPWKGRTRATGYGQTSVYGKLVEAHRFSYELLVGRIPIGLEVDHLCSNRGCVNPAHLEVVPHRENIQRTWRRRTRCRNGHAIPAEPTYMIGRKGPIRRCLECEKAANARKLAKRRAEGFPKRKTPPAERRRRDRLMPQLRARAGDVCEGCGRIALRRDVQHVFGRPGSGHCLGEWANAPELLLLLCRVCHNACDRGESPALRDRLRQLAVGRLAARYGLSVPDWEPSEQARWCVRQLEGRGEHPDAGYKRKRAEIRAAVRVLEEAGERP